MDTPTSQVGDSTPTDMTANAHRQDISRTDRLFHAPALAVDWRGVRAAARANPWPLSTVVEECAPASQRPRSLADIVMKSARRASARSVVALRVDGVHARNGRDKRCHDGLHGCFKATLPGAREGSSGEAWSVLRTVADRSAGRSRV